MLGSVCHLPDRPHYVIIKVKDCSVMKKIEGFDYYYITEDGKVYSNARGSLKELSYSLHHKGYNKVAFSNRKSYFVHRLVALTYIPNPHGLAQVNHKNRDKLDNRVENLEWCDNDYNISHALAKQWRVCDPSGKWETIKNLSQYCKERGLSDSNLRKRGKSKGYLCRLSRP